MPPRRVVLAIHIKALPRPSYPLQSTSSSDLREQLKVGEDVRRVYSMSRTMSRLSKLPQKTVALLW